MEKTNGVSGPSVVPPGGPQHPLQGQLDSFGPGRDAPLPGPDRRHSAPHYAGRALLGPADVDFPHVVALRSDDHHNYRYV